MDATTPGRGMEGGRQVTVNPFRHEGVFVANCIGGGICTKNMVPGVAAYNGKIISIQNEDGTKVECRVWNPFRSTVASAIILGVENIWINGVVYALEISPTRCKELVNMAARRANVIPIIEDARHPENYRTLIGEKVDVVFCDIAETDQVTILVKNATYYLKEGGHYLMSVKADCNATLSDLFDQEESELEAEQFSPDEAIVLDPFMANHIN